MNAPTPTLHLVFVCTGNTCRSPMAEAIARRAAADRGWSGVEVRSAGVAAFGGSRASGGAVRAAARNGLDLRDHRSTQLDPALVDWADLILVMSPAHLMRVMELGGGDRAALLTAFAAGDAASGDPGFVPDPIGGSDEEYLHTFSFLEELIERSLERVGPPVVE